MKPEFIESFGKLVLCEGDTVVLKTAENLGDYAVTHIERQTKACFSERGLNNIGVLLLVNGMGIGVIRKAKSEVIES